MKKDLKWRLKDLPNVTEVNQLVSTGVLTKEEAKDLLFNEGITKDDKDKVEALEKQIEFLQDLVNELSKNRTNTVIHTTEIVKRYEPYWREYRPYWMSASNNTGTLMSGMQSANNMSLTSYTQKLIG